MFLDLDRFKNVNDTLGHNTGDLLLSKVAAWLQKCIRGTDTAARLGSDEYAILLPAISRESAQRIAEQVEPILERTGLSPEWLTIEITESMTADAAHALQILDRLRSIGIQVSIDDFGTGYSSFSYLSRFPITKLKIDQSFVRDLTENRQAIVKAIIDLAQNLNLKVIAEGVESNEQAELLLALNCTEAQGYLYAKPFSPEEIEKRLSKC